MSTILERAKARRGALRKSVSVKYPHLLPCVVAPAIDRTAIVLGRDELGAPLHVPLKARLEHSHVTGTTGGGKTKGLEHCVRQDIVDGRGVCVIDPHGNHPDSLYRSLLSWLDIRGFTKTRTIHLIDPNATTHSTGLAPLTPPSPDYDCTVIAEAMQEALERVWGEEDMNTKPTMQRVLNVVLTALTELKLTLAEARLLLDPEDRDGVRRWAIGNLKDDEAREELEWLDAISREPRGRHDFRLEATGPRNRLAKLTRGESIRTMLGQQDRTIDFRTALDEGHIILANLSPGPRASDAAVQLLGRLITRMMFFHCVRRKHPERPFFFYLDECQLYLSGDVSRMLAEARKYGCGVILSHQFLSQLETVDVALLDAVKNATNVKVVFRIKDPEEASSLADMVLRYDLEIPVRTLIKPTVIGQRVVELNSRSVSDQIATTEMSTETKGEGTTTSYTYGETVAETISEALTTAEGITSSSAEMISSANGASAGDGFASTQTSVPGGGLFAIPNPVSTSQGQSTQSSSSRVSGSSSAQGQSSSVSTARTSGHAITTASSWSEGIGFSTSSSRSIGKGETRGTGNTRGIQEGFESIFEDRPTAVHSLENVRYMAAQVLRNLTTGRAAISFVDATGGRAASLTVANVESYALPADEFERLRERVLDASPSATPIQSAIENLAKRKAELLATIRIGNTACEPSKPAQFRIKKKRPSKAKSHSTPSLHGEQRPAVSADCQGRPTAVASGDRDP